MYAPIIVLYVYHPYPQSRKTWPTGTTPNLVLILGDGPTNTLHEDCKNFRVTVIGRQTSLLYHTMQK